MSCHTTTLTAVQSVNAAKGPVIQDDSSKSLIGDQSVTTVSVDHSPTLKCLNATWPTIIMFYS